MCHYLKSIHFFLDLIPCLPLSYFFVYTRYFHFIRLIKVLRFKKELQLLSFLNLPHQTKYCLKVVIYISFLAIFILSSGAIWSLEVKLECEWLPLIQNLVDWRTEDFCEKYTP